MPEGNELVKPSLNALADTMVLAHIVTKTLFRDYAIFCT
jgi:hypothetical protein